MFTKSKSGGGGVEYLRNEDSSIYPQVPLPILDLNKLNDTPLDTYHKVWFHLPVDTLRNNPDDPSAIHNRTPNVLYWKEMGNLQIAYPSGMTSLHG